MGSQNIFLEIADGAVTIDTAFFLLWCAFHLYFELQRRALTWYLAILSIPSIAIVTAMFAEKIGTEITRSMIWIWRLGGGSKSFAEIENEPLIVGSLITSIGLLWMIAILSRPRFGNLPWRIAAGVTVCYVLISGLSHFSF